ncbi:hypothetical protein X733_33180 [Mesorhizobium sp. L2C067A000]|nr:hypothetical protein X733_33180 [Mesorhizobium sp. L2C067A000]
MRLDAMQRPDAIHGILSIELFKTDWRVKWKLTSLRQCSAVATL